MKNPFNYAEIRADTVDAVTNYTQEYDSKDLQRKTSGDRCGKHAQMLNVEKEAAQQKIKGPVCNI